MCMYMYIVPPTCNTIVLCFRGHFSLGTGSKSTAGQYHKEHKLLIGGGEIEVNVNGWQCNVTPGIGLLSQTYKSWMIMHFAYWIACPSRMKTFTQHTVMLEARLDSSHIVIYSLTSCLHLLMRASHWISCCSIPWEGPGDRGVIASDELTHNASTQNIYTSSKQTWLAING